MSDRVLAEFELLRALFPHATLGNSWVLLADYLLPGGRYNLERTPVLFSIPVGYPNTGPDNFFVDVALRLHDGGMPPGFNPNSNSSTGPAPVNGSWGWFSWHPQSWRPTADPRNGDNLATFVKGVGVCLRGEESA